MNFKEIDENESKWRLFLSSIKGISNLPSNNVNLKTKTSVANCLSSEFANKLLKKKGGTVEISSERGVLDRYKDLDVRGSPSTLKQTESYNVDARAEETPETPSVCRQIVHEETERGRKTIDSSDEESINCSDEGTINSSDEGTINCSDEESINCSDEGTINSSDEEPNFIDTFPTSNNKEDSVLITSNGKQNVKCDFEDDQAYNDKEPTKEEDRNSSKVPTKEQKKCDESAPSRLELKVEDLCHLKDDIQIERVRERDSLPRVRKSDMDMPCSKWTLSNIAEYFVFDNCVKEIHIPTTFDERGIYFDIYLKVKDRIQELKAFKGIQIPKSRSIHVSDSICQIKSISANEAGCRLIIDAILIPVCLSFGYQIEVDKNINCSFLPNCRFDYCIKKDDTIIGCVETKSIKSLSGASVVQAILELMILQTTLFTGGTTPDDFMAFPLFAIITDGHRFIYIQLDDSMLGFEHDDHKKVKVHEVRKDDDFKTILQHICFLMNGGKGV